MRAAPRVLLVEDDPATAALLAEWLRAEGYRPAVARDQAQAAAALAAGRFDLVLADSLYRPGTGGAGDRWAALERLRDLARPAPVVICTAYSPAEFAGYAARGFGALVPKPFRLAALAEVVHGQLAADG
jgi:CheY-like chemotaxis protein